MPIPENHVVGDSGHVAEHNALAGAVNDIPGSVAAALADADTVQAAAAAAVQAAAADLVVIPRRWRVTATITGGLSGSISYPGGAFAAAPLLWLQPATQYVNGGGFPLVVLPNFTGTAHCNVIARWADGSNYAGALDLNILAYPG